MIENDSGTVEMLMTSRDIDDKHEGTVVEEDVVLTAPEMCIPAAPSIFQDPNVFIGDTGASTHGTMHKEGIVGNRTELDVTMMGNGEHVQAEKVGNISGTICNKNGTEISKGVMQDVSYRPGLNCNVFGIIKIQMNR